jgi:NAD(P)-dependent dehydrogenase (short-subunit alcohol dehydrogenase family)
MFYAPTWARDDSATAARLSGKWLLVTTPGELADAVATQMRAAGSDVLVVAPGARLDSVRAATGPLAGAIYLASLPAAGGDPVERAYHGPVELAATFGNRPLTVIIATSGAESVLDEPVRDPQAALSLGPVLTLPTEFAGLRMRAVDVDLDDVDASAKALVEEAALGDGEQLVARRAGRRWVRRFERVTLPPADGERLPLRPNGVYLITGGLGGIGLTLARRLAKEQRARLLLTARRPPGPEARDERSAAIRRAIAELQSLGGEVLVAAADAADDSAMRQAVATARARWGAIDGVVHAAGVPGTGALAIRKTAAEVAATLAPKIGGLSTLVRVLGDERLDFVVLLSSINAVLGAPGVCEYASANAALDAFTDADQRPAAWRRVVAIDYGPWRDVGMAQTLVVPESQRNERAELLRGAISPEAGAEAFMRVLASGRRRMIVCSYDLIGAREQIRAAAVAEDMPASPRSLERPDVPTRYDAPSTDVEREVAGIWSELLGIDRIGVHDDFFELGGHSLLATRVLARIDERLGARLALRDFFEAPTIQLLAVRLAAARSEPARDAEVALDREELEF